MSGLSRDVKRKNVSWHGNIPVEKLQEDAYRLMVLVCSAITAGIGILALAGWVTGMPGLASFGPYKPMAPGAALAFILLGSTWFLYSMTPSSRLGRLCVLASIFFVSVVVLLRLIQFFTGFTSGIEEVLVREVLALDPKTYGAGPMSPIAAASFLLACISMILLLLVPMRRAAGLSGGFATAVVSVNMVTLLGYLYGTPELYGGVRPVALPAGLALMSLGVGLIAAAGPDHFPMRFLVGSSVRTLLLRASLLAIFVVALADGILHNLFSLLKLNDALRAALITLFSVVVASIVVSQISRVIGGARDLSESERRRAEEKLRESETRYHTLFKQSPDGILIIDPETAIAIEFNEAAHLQLGYTREEFKRLRIFDYEAKEKFEETKAHIQKVLREGRDDFETRHHTRDGELRNILVTVMTIELAGKTVFHCLFRDITERKRAEMLSLQSKAMFQGLFDFAPDAIVVVNREGHIVRINTQVEKIFGYSQDEVLGQPVEILMPERFRERHVEHRMGYMTQPHIRLMGRGLELYGRRKDGSEFPVDITLGPLETEEGIVVLGIIHDITEHKQAEEELELLVEQAEMGRQRADDLAIEAHRRANEAEEERRILESLMEYIPEGITIASAPEVTIRMVSKYGQELTGRPRDVLVGIPAEEHAEKWGIFHTDGVTLAKGEELPLIRATLHGEVVIDEEWIIRRPDGKNIPLLFTAGPIRDRSGRITGGVVAWRDITQRKQIEEKLKQTMADLERSNKELEQFAYVASHDMQEPLRMVANFTQLLENRYKGKLDKDADEFIGFVVDGTTRMQRMIDDLLGYSRVGTRSKPFQPTDCEIVFNEAIANLKLAIEGSGAAITHDPLPTITADGSQMVQLFQNLLSNAIKFCKEKPQVHISARKDGNDWVFSVKDNGIGIAPEFFDRLFQIFQRQHARSEYPGTGIGLAVCKKIVERHGGRIWVESEPGEGSTFYFTIPVGKGQEFLEGM